MAEASSGGKRLRCEQGGLRQLTYALAAEFGPHHIRVNAIAPASSSRAARGQASVEAESTAREIARTPCVGWAWQRTWAKLQSSWPVMMRPYITGTTIVLDGGAMAVW